jgi:threonine dehydrogenase-like Zn-dependent dehydrogenase
MAFKLFTLLTPPATSGNKIARPGGFAEYAIFESDLAFRIPESVSFDEAATFPLCSLTAAQVSLILSCKQGSPSILLRHYSFAFDLLPHS